MSKQAFTQVTGAITVFGKRVLEAAILPHVCPRGVLGQVGAYNHLKAAAGWPPILRSQRSKQRVVIGANLIFFCHQ